MAKLVIDPLTRVEGHLKIELNYDETTGIVNSATSHGTLFRNFENMLIGRPPKDAAFITQRICGVCPVPHALAASLAVENAVGASVPNTGKAMRNIILGAEHVMSNILHFYHLSAQDFIDTKGTAFEGVSPVAPGYSHPDLVKDPATVEYLVGSYVSALKIRRIAHELGAMFSGKLPHTANVVPGGVTMKASQTDEARARAIVAELETFVNGTYTNDVVTVKNVFGPNGPLSDASAIGGGYEKLITFGMFESIPGVNINGFIPGRNDGSFNESNIAEYIEHSRYNNTSGVNPMSGATTPLVIDETSFADEHKYTWLKAPRYNGQPYEAGPLARVTVSGLDNGALGVSVIDRHHARLIETGKILENIKAWLDFIYAPSNRDIMGYTPIEYPKGEVSGIGLTEAPRGAIGHWVKINNGLLSHYQIITPTCWNASPKDDMGQAGPIEKALEGITMVDPKNPVEVLRVVHSFDPCLGCAVHVISPEGKEMSKFTINPGV